MRTTRRDQASGWVVIVNYEGRADTEELLGDIVIAGAPYRILVVDNGSSDGLEAALRDDPRWAAVEVIPTGSNLGFAGGYNIGIRHALAAGATTVCVLKDDTQVAPEALHRLLNLARDNGRAISPGIRYAEAADGAWLKGMTFDADRGRPVHLGSVDQPAGPEAFRTPFLTGCCIAAASWVWERVGLFDERFFLIFEDSDWSARAVRLGVELWVEPSVTIPHKVSRSFVGARADLAMYYFTRNGLRFARGTDRAAARHVSPPSRACDGRLATCAATMDRRLPCGSSACCVQ